MFLAGCFTASFYGWLPLYLPELFPTAVCATGQGFAFNFGRILAAVGALQTGYLMKEVFDGDYARACSLMSVDLPGGSRRHLVRPRNPRPTIAGVKIRPRMTRITPIVHYPCTSLVHFSISAIRVIRGPTKTIHR